MFSSVAQFIPKQNRGGRLPAFAADVVFSTDKHSPTGGEKFALRISLSAKILKEARMMRGDRVDLCFDKETRRGLIRRTNDGMWGLGKNGGKTGPNCRLILKLTWYPGMPTTKASVECDSTVTPEGIVFSLPECVSFDKNLRAGA